MLVLEKYTQLKMWREGLFLKEHDFNTFFSHSFYITYLCSSNKINFLSLLFCCRRRTKNLFRYAFSHATSLISKLNVCLRYVQCFISNQIHCIKKCVRADSEFNVVHWKIGMWCMYSIRRRTENVIFKGNKN